MKIRSYFLLLVLLGLMISVQPYCGKLLINISSSLPHYIYWLSPKPYDTYQAGDKVAFILPEGIAESGRFAVKAIAGMPGDDIHHEHSKAGVSIRVNQHMIGLALPYRADGQSLTPITAGKIPPRHYFVATKHQQSLDSRYQNIGLIPKSLIQGKAYAIF